MFDKEKICDTMNSKLEKLYNSIKAVSFPITREKKNLQDLITNVSNIESPVDIDSITSKMDDAVDSVNSDDMENDISDLIKCFSDSGLETNIKLDLSETNDMIKNTVNDFVGDLFDPSESGLLDSINNLESAISTEQIDKMTSMSQCLESLCPGGTTISLLDIENELNNNGISITGEIDLDLFNNVSGIKDRITTLKDKKKDIEKSIEDKIKGII